MQQGNGNLDKELFEVFEEMDIDRLGHDPDAYMHKMMDRFHKEKEQATKVPAIGNGSFRTAAFSLIAAGLLLGFVYTTGMQDSLINFECKIKSNYAMMKSNIDIGKIFIGEWNDGK